MNTVWAQETALNRSFKNRRARNIHSVSYKLYISLWQSPDSELSLTPLLYLLTWRCPCTLGLHLTNQNRVLTVLANQNRVLTILTNQNRVLISLTNQRPTSYLTTGHWSDRAHCPPPGAPPRCSRSGRCTQLCPGSDGLSGGPARAQGQGAQGTPYQSHVRPWW